MKKYYLDDLRVGQKFHSGTVCIDAEAIKEFASEFDPQPFHLDEEAARESFFGGLAASGWHTAALTMRLLVDSDFHPAEGLIGTGFENLSWPHPVRPGDELQVEIEILGVRQSQSKPHLGIVTVALTTRNQAGTTVQSGVTNTIVPTKEQPAP